MKITKFKKKEYKTKMKEKAKMMSMLAQNKKNCQDWVIRYGAFFLKIDKNTALKYGHLCAIWLKLEIVKTFGVRLGKKKAKNDAEKQFYEKKVKKMRLLAKKNKKKFHIPAVYSGGFKKTWEYSWKNDLLLLA